MPKHHIVCADHTETHGHSSHHHITSVGTGSHVAGMTKRWSLKEVLAALDHGDVFYTEGETSKRVAEVEKYHCHVCGGLHIRTKPDHAHDNNLDSLKHCPVRRDRDDCQSQPDRRHG